MKTEKTINSDAVESLDVSRYVTIKWLTISFVLFSGPFIAHYIMGSMGVDKFYQMHVNMPILLIGMILFQVFVIRFVIIMKRINSNSEYKQILNNEYYVSTTSKSLRNAVMSSVFVLGGSILVTTFYPSLPAVLVCLIILFIVSITAMISWLVYNR